MRLTSLLSIPLALTASTALTASDYENSIACAAKNPSTNAAIDAFCNKRDAAGQFSDDIFVPSPRSKKGAAVGGINVKITGNCSPKQYVPLQYCGPQFHAMCAQGGPKDGLSKRRFGRNGCQLWSIERESAAGRVAGMAADAGARKAAANSV